mgnify:CR=1 FL=1
MYPTTKTLLKTSRRAQACIGRIVQKQGISIAEHPFVMTIKFNDGLTQDELSYMVGVDRALTTRTVQSLEKKGLVRKEPDSKDKRYNHVYATDSLHQLTDKIVPELLAFNEAAMDGISEEEISKMIDTMQRFENNISNYIKDLDSKK